MTREHPLEARLRTHWGHSRRLLRAPAGCLLLAEEANASSVLVQLILPTGSEATLVENIRRFLARTGGEHHPGLLWPDVGLIDEGLPALRYPLAGPASLLPRALRDTRDAWPLRRLVGQLVPIARGLAELHTAGEAHGAVAPLSVIIEQVDDQSFLRLISAELWKPLRVVGLAPAESLGAGMRDPGDPRPLPADDIRAFGHLLDWLRSAYTDEPWPSALTALSERCVAAAPINSLALLDGLRDVLALWHDLEPSDEQPDDDRVGFFDPIVGCVWGVRIELESEDGDALVSQIEPTRSDAVSVHSTTVIGSEGDNGGDLFNALFDSASGDSRAVVVGGAAPSARREDPKDVHIPAERGRDTLMMEGIARKPPSPVDEMARALEEQDGGGSKTLLDVDHQNIARRDGAHYGSGTSSGSLPKPAASLDPGLAHPDDLDLAKFKNTAMIDRGWDDLFDDEGAEDATTLVINRNALSGMFEAAEAEAKSTAAAETSSDPKGGSITERVSANKISIIGKRSEKTEEERTDPSPTEEVRTMEQVLRSENPPQTAQRLVLVLLAVLVIVVALLVWRFAFAAPAMYTPPTSEVVRGDQRVVLNARPRGPLRHVAVDPAGRSYALCTDHEVQLWSTDPRGPRRLDRVWLPHRGCQALSYTADGLGLVVMTDVDGRSVASHHDIARGVLEVMTLADTDAPPRRWRQMRALTRDALLIEGDRGEWWLWSAEGARRLALPKGPGRWRACEGSSDRVALMFRGEALALVALDQGALLKRASPGVVRGCAVDPSGLEASVLVEDQGLLRWPLVQDAPNESPVLEASALESTSLHAQLRYADSLHLMVAFQDRVLSVRAPFKKIDRATQLVESAKGGQWVPSLSTYDGDEVYPIAGSLSALVFDGARARLYDLTTGQPRSARESAESKGVMVHDQSLILDHGAAILSVFLTRGEGAVDVLGPDGAMVLWDLEDMQVTAQRQLGARPLVVAPAPGGRRAALVMAPPPESRIIEGRPIEYPLHLIDLEDLSTSASQMLDVRLSRMRWSPTGRHLLTENLDGERVIYRVGASRFEEIMRMDAREPAAFHDDATLLVWSKEGLIGVDLSKGRRSPPLLGPEALPEGWRVRAIDAHPSSRALVLAAGDQGAARVQLPERASERARFEILMETGPVERARISPDGAQIWAGAGVYDSVTGQRIVTLSPPPSSDENATFAPNSAALVSTTRRWSLATGDAEVQAPLPARSGVVDDQRGHPGLHPGGAWRLNAGGGLFAEDAPEARLDYVIDGLGAWAMASRRAAVANEEGAALVAQSDGFRALKGTPSLDIDALRAALGAPTWRVAEAAHEVAQIALPFPVSLTLKSEPEGAEVWRETGRGATRRVGVTPMDWQSPPSAEPVRFELRKLGYQPQPYDWTPDSDLSLTIALTPAANAASALRDAEAAFVHITGNLDATTMLTIVSNRRDSIVECKAGLERVEPGSTPDALSTTLLVNADGKVELVRMTSTAPLTLRRCLREAVMQWRFPPNASSSLVTYRFLLEHY